MQDDSQLYPDATSLQVHDAPDRLVEGSLCLNDVVVPSSHIGIKRDADHQIRMSDLRDFLTQRQVTKHPAVRKHVNRRRRQMLLATCNEMRESVAKQRWLAASNSQSSCHRINE